MTTTFRALAASLLAALSLALPVTAQAAGGPDQGPADPSASLTVTRTQSCTGRVGQVRLTVVNHGSTALAAQFIVDATVRSASLAPGSRTIFTIGALRSGEHVAVLWANGWDVYDVPLTVACPLTVKHHRPTWRL